MNVVLETFAIEAQANQNKIILLVQDRAGWRHEAGKEGAFCETVRCGGNPR